MPDEDLDNLIRDAANQHHPPYDDKAWGKMKTLLDKHMPQKKHRKKLLLFFMLFLLAGSVFIYVLEKTPQKSLPVAGVKNTQESNYSSTPKNNQAGKIIAPNKNNYEGTADTENKTEKFPLTDNTTIATITPDKKNNSADNNFNAYSKNKNVKHYNNKGRFAAKVKKPEIMMDNANLEEVKVITGNNSVDKVEKETSITTTAIQPAETIPQILPAPITFDTLNNAAADKLAAPAPKATDAKKTEKKNKGFANNFAVTLSAGEEISYININNTGKIQRFYGGGVSYAITKRITVSSGIFIADKIYTAKPGQYKFAGGTYNATLIRIDANCKVYEIPIWVRYNFMPVKNHNWFAGLGISSYLMKKESYNYVYKNTSGQLWSYLNKVSDKNKNYLSVLTISGGYQYVINKRFAFLAAPFLKLAIKGVGEGKVKLNNTGILVTAAIKPFGH